MKKGFYCYCCCQKAVFASKVNRIGVGGRINQVPQSQTALQRQRKMQENAEVKFSFN
jgi:hypothetical protein